MPQAGVPPATALESRVPAAGSRHRYVLMSDEGSGLPVHLTQMSTPRMLRAPHLTGSPPHVAASAVPVVATPLVTTARLQWGRHAVGRHVVAVGAVIVWLWVCGGYKRWSRSARTNARAAQRRGRGTGTTATRPTLHILSGRHALYLAHQFSRHAGTHPSSPAHLDQYIAARTPMHQIPTGRLEQPSKLAKPKPKPNPNQASRTHGATGATL